MADKNIQIKAKNGTNWDNLFPKTKAEVVVLADGSNLEQKISNLLSAINSKVESSELAAAVADLVDSAPETLDTLKELADALGNDPNFATTISNQLGKKADKSQVYTIIDVDNLLAEKVDRTAVYVKTEIDTQLSNKADKADVHTKTEVSNLLDNKVDKVPGKQLSTEDFTTPLKNKLVGLPSSVYSKTEVDNLISSRDIPVSSTAPTNSNLWFQEI